MARWACSLSVLAYLGCGTSSSPESPGPSGNREVYGVITTPSTPDGPNESLLVLLPELRPGTLIDLASAIPVPPGSVLFGVEQSDTFFVASGEGSSVTKWTLDEEGAPVRGDVVSFLNLGAPPQFFGWAQSVIASETRGYVLDDAQDRLLIFDPSRMELVGELELPVEPEGALIPFSVEKSVLRDDGLLLITFYWADFDTFTYGERLRTIAVDTRTDTIVSTRDDERSRYAFATSVADDGTIYLSGDHFPELAKEFGGPSGTDSVGLRIIPPGADWDESYFARFPQLTEGRPSGPFVWTGENEGLIRVWFEEDAGLSSRDPFTRAVARAHRWWRWRIGDATAEPISDQQPHVPGDRRFRVDGRLFANEFRTDFSESELVEFRNGTFETIAALPGTLNGVMRIR